MPETPLDKDTGSLGSPVNWGKLTWNQSDSIK